MPAPGAVPGLPHGGRQCPVRGRVLGLPRGPFPGGSCPETAAGGAPAPASGVVSFPCPEVGCPGCGILGKVFSLQSLSWWGRRGRSRAVLEHPFPLLREQGCGAESSQASHSSESPVVCAGHCQPHAAAAALGSGTGRRSLTRES